jgi:hypothetical protein
MMEHHLPLLSVAAATDQSKLPKDDGGQLLREGVGRDGPDQSNDNDGRLQIGGGTTWVASRLQKATRISGGGTGTTIKPDCSATQQQLQR